MNLIQIISGPAVGAVIGYFTNYIAVKMLFRPYKPVKIGNWTLPFTPGVIPRRKSDLARAIGNTIENNLLGGGDIRTMLASPEMCKSVAQGVWNEIEKLLDSGMSLSDCIDSISGEGKAASLTAYAVDKITVKTGDKLIEMNLGETIASLAGEAVTQKVQNSMLGMFVTPDIIRSFLAPLADGINNYIRTEGLEKIHTFAEDELSTLSAKPLNSLVSVDTEAKERILEKIAELYASFMASGAEKLTSGMKTGKIVEEKINAMDVADFEKLVMSVMKHELGAIVNLGAVIGLVIGIVNIFL